MNTNYPQDDEKTIYLEDDGNLRLSCVHDAIYQKWPGYERDLIKITAEHRHVKC